MIEKLEQYKTLQQQIEALTEQRAALLSEIEAHVKESGEVAAYGVRAYMKKGRKATDHEAAVKAALAEYDAEDMHSLAHELRVTQLRYTTTKVTVAWAQVTKAAKLDVAPFTTEAAPVFTVEVTT